ncbi:MAG: DUF6232 family protein [Bacteroidota bacterium]|jgi:hypothetical protein|nr:MAG: hypothetical protein DIU61_17840 [Bacteroidota bacterium]
MREKTVYTDGKKVTITGYSLRVGKRLFPLEDLVRYGVARISPTRLPSILFMSLGAGIAALQYLRLIPETVYYWIPVARIAGYEVPQNILVFGTGALLFFVGAVSLIVVPTRYAVRITTNVGTMNVIVSRNRDYIERVVDAIGTALHLRNMTEALKEERARDERPRTVRREIV